jgi:hypothetical protein
MKKIAIAGLAAAAVLTAACTKAETGDDASKAATDPTPTVAAHVYNIPAEISAQQLQSVTLALADFGPRYATFETLVDAELTASIERAIDACNAYKEQTSLGNYGWSKAYSRQYGAGDGAESLANVHVGSFLDVFSTPTNAETKIRYDTKQIHEDQLAPYGCNGVGFERIDTLPLPQVGDQSWAVRINYSVAGVRGSRYQMKFRRDRLVATVMITRFNSEDSSLELMALALKMDDRLLNMITAPLTSALPSNAEREF